MMKMKAVYLIDMLSFKIIIINYYNNFIIIDRGKKFTFN